MNTNGPAPQDLAADRFAAFMVYLCDTLIAEAFESRLPGALRHLLWVRLTRLAARFARWFANPPPHPATQPPAPSRNPAPPRAKPAPAVPVDYVLPRGFFWLRHILPVRFHRITCAQAELIHLLEDPAMIQLISENPSLGRALRPLCHMLGVSRPPHLAPRPPAVARRPHRKRPKQNRRTPPGAIPDRITPPGPGSRFWPPWYKPLENPA
ncbi:hypothetical protein AruPA_10135 [Acidiphilium sp. PA]|uniref:hypothetical protein n=1 Tax=Acidiphilium sp. PA TaxID=2871705 RepID=UPI0022446272|nr:hypothetical protein [Acidiphilium sp. PA]MCW8307394.1 hypothetical protein [Acidiphilium sp. PA]